jgi:hypothetical protein
MSLVPLLEAAPAIPLHAFTAMAAFVLGIVQFAAPSRIVFASRRGPAEHIPKDRFGAGAQSATGRVSLWKNEGKNRWREPAKGWFGGPRCAI